ncbi:hypothetical protein Efla_005448 [Eimeria flavescens]
MATHGVGQQHQQEAAAAAPLREEVKQLEMQQKRIGEVFELCRAIEQQQQETRCPPSTSSDGAAATSASLEAAEEKTALSKAFLLPAAAAADTLETQMGLPAGLPGVPLPAAEQPGGPPNFSTEEADRGPLMQPAAKAKNKAVPPSFSPSQQQQQQQQQQQRGRREAGSAGGEAAAREPLVGLALQQQMPELPPPTAAAAAEFLLAAVLPLLHACSSEACSSCCSSSRSTTHKQTIKHLRRLLWIHTAEQQQQQQQQQLSCKPLVEEREAAFSSAFCWKRLLTAEADRRELQQTLQEVLWQQQLLHQEVAATTSQYKEQQEAWEQKDRMQQQQISLLSARLKAYSEQLESLRERRASADPAAASQQQQHPETQEAAESPPLPAAAPAAAAAGVRAADSSAHPIVARALRQQEKVRGFEAFGADASAGPTTASGRPPKQQQQQQQQEKGEGEGTKERGPEWALRPRAQTVSCAETERWRRRRLKDEVTPQQPLIDFSLAGAALGVDSRAKTELLLLRSPRIEEEEAELLRHPDLLHAGFASLPLAEPRWGRQPQYGGEGQAAAAAAASSSSSGIAQLLAADPEGSPSADNSSGTFLLEDLELRESAGFAAEEEKLTPSPHAAAAAGLASCPSPAAAAAAAAAAAVVSGRERSLTQLPRAVQRQLDALRRQLLPAAGDSKAARADSPRRHQKPAAAAGAAAAGLTVRVTDEPEGQGRSSQKEACLSGPWTSSCSPPSALVGRPRSLTVGLPLQQTEAAAAASKEPARPATNEGSHTVTPQAAATSLSIPLSAWQHAATPPPQQLHKQQQQLQQKQQRLLLPDEEEELAVLSFQDESAAAGRGSPQADALKAWTRTPRKETQQQQQQQESRQGARKKKAQKAVRWRTRSRSCCFAAEETASHRLLYLMPTGATVHPKVLQQQLTFTLHQQEPAHAAEGEEQQQQGQQQQQQQQSLQLPQQQQQQGALPDAPAGVSSNGRLPVMGRSAATAAAADTAAPANAAAAKAASRGIDSSSSTPGFPQMEAEEGAAAKAAAECCLCKKLAASEGQQEQAGAPDPAQRLAPLLRHAARSTGLAAAAASAPSARSRPFKSQQAILQQQQQQQQQQAVSWGSAGSPGLSGGLLGVPPSQLLPVGQALPPYPVALQPAAAVSPRPVLLVYMPNCMQQQQRQKQQQQASCEALSCSRVAGCEASAVPFNSSGQSSNCCPCGVCADTPAAGCSRGGVLAGSQCFDISNSSENSISSSSTASDAPWCLLCEGKAPAARGLQSATSAASRCGPLSAAAGAVGSSSNSSSNSCSKSSRQPHSALQATGQRDGLKPPAAAATAAAAAAARIAPIRQPLVLSPCAAAPHEARQLQQRPAAAAPQQPAKTAAAAGGNRQGEPVTDTELGRSGCGSPKADSSRQTESSRPAASRLQRNKGAEAAADAAQQQQQQHFPHVLHRRLQLNWRPLHHQQPRQQQQQQPRQQAAGGLEYPSVTAAVATQTSLPLAGRAGESHLFERPFCRLPPGIDSQACPCREGLDYVSLAAGDLTSVSSTSSFAGHTQQLLLQQEEQQQHAQQEQPGRAAAAAAAAPVRSGPPPLQLLLHLPAAEGSSRAAAALSSSKQSTSPALTAKAALNRASCGPGATALHPQVTHVQREQQILQLQHWQSQVQQQQHAQHHTLMQQQRLFQQQQQHPFMHQPRLPGCMSEAQQRSAAPQLRQQQQRQPHHSQQQPQFRLQQQQQSEQQQQQLLQVGPAAALPFQFFEVATPALKHVVYVQLAERSPRWLAPPGLTQQGPPQLRLQPSSMPSGAAAAAAMKAAAPPAQRDRLSSRSLSAPTCRDRTVTAATPATGKTLPTPIPPPLAAAPGLVVPLPQPRAQPAASAPATAAAAAAAAKPFPPPSGLASAYIRLVSEEGCSLQLAVRSEAVELGLCPSREEEQQRAASLSLLLYFSQHSTPL